MKHTITLRGATFSFTSTEMRKFVKLVSFNKSGYTTARYFADHMGWETVVTRFDHDRGTSIGEARVINAKRAEAALELMRDAGFDVRVNKSYRPRWSEKTTTAYRLCGKAPATTLWDSKSRTVCPCCGR